MSREVEVSADRVSWVGTSVRALVVMVDVDSVNEQWQVSDLIYSAMSLLGSHPLIPQGDLPFTSRKPKRVLAPSRAAILYPYFRPESARRVDNSFMVSKRSCLQLSVLFDESQGGAYPIHPSHISSPHYTARACQGCMSQSNRASLLLFSRLGRSQRSTHEPAIVHQPRSLSCHAPSTATHLLFWKLIHHLLGFVALAPACPVG